ncbi:MAG: hypothetical protein GXP38_17385, partial [Chloroflexi bacterium]|nr:hypothetical protein [Chloroflexota bacterium]
PEAEDDVEGASPLPYRTTSPAAAPIPPTPTSPAPEAEDDVEGASPPKKRNATEITTTVGEVATEFSTASTPPPSFAAAPPPSPTPAPPPSPPTPPSRGQRRQLSILIPTALFGALLALITIYFINGTLDFGRHEVITAINSDIDTTNTRLEKETIALQNLSDTVQNTATQVDAIAAQIQTMEEQTQALEKHIGTISGDIGTIRTDIRALAAQSSQFSEHLATIDAQLQRFETFTSGLKDLADSIQPQATTTNPYKSLSPTATQSPPDVGSQQIETDIVTGSYALQIFPPQNPIHTPPAGQSLIFGLVWDDLNSNGLPEANEIPLPNVRIILKDIHNEPLAEAVTGADGRYLFPNLIPGAYVITETDPPGTVSVTPNNVTVTTVANGLVEINFADSHLPPP